ncbi:MAG TPA: hypothetical protein IAB09_06270 [Candidatus Avilachnospira avicola]|nr:hypothetical protein [Candidatus Avilachnospira avicola]
MNNILFINACVRPDSRTRLLAKKVLERLNGNVTELDLEAEGLRPLDWPTLHLTGIFHFRRP